MVSSPDSTADSRRGGLRATAELRRSTEAPSTGGESARESQVRPKATSRSEVRSAHRGRGATNGMATLGGPLRFSSLKTSAPTQDSRAVDDLGDVDG
jgi:hypothetical protein